MSREWTRQRLENWARWASERASKGLGFSKTNPIARLGGTASTASESVIPVNDLDACRTDAAVAAMRHEAGDLWLTLMARYIGNPWERAARRRPMSQREIAALLMITDRTVRTRLEAAEQYVSQQLERLKV